MSSLLNRLAPDFARPALDGRRFSLSEWRGHVAVINFWSAECPWSRRADVLLVYRLLSWDKKGVRVVGVASNINEPETEILYEAQHRHVTFPIVIDAEHQIADLYRAETTPHFFVTDRQGIVRYAGALDDATYKQRDAKTFYLDHAVSALLDNRLPDPATTVPYGCALVRQPTADSSALIPR